MKYILWIGVTVALLMVVTGNDKLWPVVLLTGMIANGLVIGINRWKMPVWGRKEEGARHTPMTPDTRLWWLGDVIPVGMGIASIGDFLIMAGWLGVWINRSTAPYIETIAMFTFGLWTLGWAGGFNLKEKWTVEERRDSRKNIPILMILILLGNLFGVRGCGRSEMAASIKSTLSLKPIPEIKQASVPVSVTVKHWRSLGEVALQPPPFEVLKRLKRENERQERARVREAAIAAVVQGGMWSVVTKRVRTGPACHVTCTGCHGQWDRETLPEFCKANWISPRAAWVPGWDDISDGYEVTTGRPGPATLGFKSYKLYWK